MLTTGSNTNFAITKITIEQFDIFQELYKEEGKIGLFFNFSFGVDRDTRMLAIYALFKFEENDIAFLIIETGCHFQIEKEKWESFFNEDKNMLVPNDDICHLAKITVGTARGILHAKTENTSLNRFIIPETNVSDMIKEDVPF